MIGDIFPHIEMSRFLIQHNGNSNYKSVHESFDICAFYASNQWFEKAEPRGAHLGLKEIQCTSF